MTVLLLAGTGDAKQIASGLADAGVKTVASLAGATRTPDTLVVPTRVGGFGDEAGFRAYLHRNGITAVLDATHPFATKITDRTAQVCKDLRLPHLLYVRPQWEPTKADNWTFIAREEDAAQHIPENATVFLGTGRQTLSRFANLEGRRVICRQIDPPTAPFPFEGGEFLIGRPPFPVSREKELFLALGINWVIVKNAGGEASRTKLDAAADLSIPVLMIKRPKTPLCKRVDTVVDAVNWAKAL